MALFKLYKEVLFLKAILEELNIYKSKLIPLFIKNQEVLNLRNRN